MNEAKTNYDAVTDALKQLAAATVPHGIDLAGFQSYAFRSADFEKNTHILLQVTLLVPLASVSPASADESSPSSSAENLLNSNQAARATASALTSPPVKGV